MGCILPAFLLHFLSFLQQTFTEQILCARHYSSYREQCWKRQTRLLSCPHGGVWQRGAWWQWNAWDIQSWVTQMSGAEGSISPKKTHTQNKPTCIFSGDLYLMFLGLQKLKSNLAHNRQVILYYHRSSFSTACTTPLKSYLERGGRKWVGFSTKL